MTTKNAEEEYVILGLTEPVEMIGKKGTQKVIARIDTGAERSSVDISLAKELDLGTAKMTTIVRSASGKGERKLVKAKVIMRNDEISSLFTLADRRNLKYKILIGQNILKNGKYLIDPSKG